MKLFIAQTLDGFIAGENDDLSYLQPYHGLDFGYDAHLQSVDAAVLGRRTFDVIYPKYGWTYPASLPGVVMTSRPLPAGTPAQVVTATDPGAVAAQYPNAYVDGGASVIRAFLQINAINEARIFTLPIMIGSGVRLFSEAPGFGLEWRLDSSTVHAAGVVENRYLKAG
ncbi:MAG: bifunctional deaminase-reductase domain-containing protein [bacterium]|nr:MAG: bifunctional deaminase-reductase domain-containing protein [bacterium]